MGMRVQRSDGTITTVGGNVNNLCKHFTYGYRVEVELNNGVGWHWNLFNQFDHSIAGGVASSVDGAIERASSSVEERLAQFESNAMKDVLSVESCSECTCEKPGSCAAASPSNLDLESLTEIASNLVTLGAEILTFVEKSK